MNKVELIKAVAEATNNTQKDIKVIMEAVQDVTYGALVERRRGKTDGWCYSFCCT